METKQKNPVEKFVNEHPVLVSFGVGLAVGAIGMRYKTKVPKFHLTTTNDQLRHMMSDPKAGLSWAVPKLGRIDLVHDLADLTK